MNTILSLKYFIPELYLTALILIVLISDLLFSKENKEKSGTIALWGAVILLIFLSLGKVETHSLFFGTIVTDAFGKYFKILATLAVIFTIWSSKHTESLKKYNKGEYFTLLLIITLGIFLLASSIDLLMIYLSFELLSIMSYVLTAYLLKDSNSNEASLKYIIYGAFSSGIMLFGLTWLYGLTGSLRLDTIHLFLLNYTGTPLPVFISIMMILVGLGFKIAAVPFHFWSPDVYQGAPTPFTAFLSTAPKAAGFAILIRFFSYTFSGEGALIAESWSALEFSNWPMLLAIVSAITMTLGNLTAIHQTNIKRMLAYSSIAHAGYLMMGLVVLNMSGLYAILFYLMIYLLMNLGAFFVTVYVENKFGNSDISSFRGLGFKVPIVGIVMSLFLFSLTGLPPTAGFIGKFYIFAAIIRDGNQWIWLAVIGILNSVVSLYYYAGVIKMMYLAPEEGDKTPLTISNSYVVLLLILVIPIFIFGIYWAPLHTFIASSLHFYLPL